MEETRGRPRRLPAVPVPRRDRVAPRASARRRAPISSISSRAGRIRCPKAMCATLTCASLRDAATGRSFRTFWKSSRDRDLQCDALRARIDRRRETRFRDRHRAALVESAHAARACDRVLALARSERHADRCTGLGSAPRCCRGWQYGDSAAAAAAMLSGADRESAERIVAAVRNPASALSKADQWPDTAANARRDRVWPRAIRATRQFVGRNALGETRLRFSNGTTPQKNRVLNALAVYRSTSYSPDALARLKALPPEAEDDTSREWHVRTALAIGDFKETLAALDDLSAPQQADSRWRYLRARVLTKLDRKSDAAADLRRCRARSELSRLSRRRLDRSSRTRSAPRTLATDPRFRKNRREPDRPRARVRVPDAWHAARSATRMGFRACASSAIPKSRLAADLAYRRGWYDRAVFFYSADPDTQRLYEQRFPLALETRVKREAGGAGIDPAWAYAIIRAESAWMTDAHSHADAYGLMQLLPGVAKSSRKSEKLPYNHPSDLFDPDAQRRSSARAISDAWPTGSKAVRGSRARHTTPARHRSGAGSTRAASLDPDFFIETIPYKETREYVARVLAFSVIYDWRMNGKAAALASRMPRIGQAYAAPTDATPRKGVSLPDRACAGDRRRRRSRARARRPRRGSAPHAMLPFHLRRPRARRVPPEASMKPQRIVILGGTGFVGSHLVPRLHAARPHDQGAVAQSRAAPRSGRAAARERRHGRCLRRRRAAASSRRRRHRDQSRRHPQRAWQQRQRLSQGARRAHRNAHRRHAAQPACPRRCR